MTISRSSRITILLVIDVLFFFVELIVGYAVGSLALVADSFHMLNDVMSLIVALYAIKLTARRSTDSRYSYGWHRAEILAALINGVFLLALCFSISLEALGRFFSTPEISSPKLVVIVGSLGLASNIVGLFLFHEHSHSHGQSHSTPASASSSKAPSITSLSVVRAERAPSNSQKLPQKPSRHSRSDSFSSLYGHPIATRASLVQTAQEIAHAGSPPTRRQNSAGFRRSFDHVNEIEEQEQGQISSPEPTTSTHTRHPNEESPLLPVSDRSISPSPSQDKQGGHSHAGSMNMRALVLHVLGDALGNVGVIATGLIIWLTEWSFKYYCDPIISLLITVIIFSSALPLVRSASFILLQATPSNVSVEGVRDSILNVDGVLSLHELHIWQLSESKIVASVHVMASRKHDFMPIAAKIREVLHNHGIHSSTIQPEYHNPRNTEDALKSATNTPCLILCPANAQCDPQENACCPPPRPEV